MYFYFAEQGFLRVNTCLIGNITLLHSSSVCLVLSDQFVSLHEVLAVGAGPQVDCPAQYDGDVEQAEGEAAVEDLHRRQGDEGVD